MDEISNTMSLQFPASLSSGNDTGADKGKTDSIPMHEHADKAIEDFLHDKTRLAHLAPLPHMEAISSQAASGPAASQPCYAYVRTRCS